MLLDKRKINNSDSILVLFFFIVFFKNYNFSLAENKTDFNYCLAPLTSMGEIESTIYNDEDFLPLMQTLENELKSSSWYCLVFQVIDIFYQNSETDVLSYEQPRRTDGKFLEKLGGSPKDVMTNIGLRPHILGLSMTGELTVKKYSSIEKRVSYSTISKDLMKLSSQGYLIRNNISGVKKFRMTAKGLKYAASLNNLNVLNILKNYYSSLNEEIKTLSLNRFNIITKYFMNYFSYRRKHADYFSYYEEVAKLYNVNAKKQEIRDLFDHCERVAILSQIIANELNLSLNIREKLNQAALLHDIGKLADNELFSLIRFPRKLTQYEKDIVAKHPNLSSVVINILKIRVGREVKYAIINHHNSLMVHSLNSAITDEASIISDILTVADYFDGNYDMARPYKKGMYEVNPEIILDNLLSIYRKRLHHDVTLKIKEIVQNRDPSFFSILGSYDLFTVIDDEIENFDYANEFSSLTKKSNLKKMIRKVPGVNLKNAEQILKRLEYISDTSKELNDFIINMFNYFETLGNLGSNIINSVFFKTFLNEAINLKGFVNSANDKLLHLIIQRNNKLMQQAC